MGMRDRIKKLRKERNKWRRLESQAASHVESLICMRTTFHGEPPYVGWQGLGLKLKEEFDRRDEMRDVLRKIVNAHQAARVDSSAPAVNNMVLIGTLHDAAIMLKRLDDEDAAACKVFDRIWP
jgi:hypothetical protein